MSRAVLTDHRLILCLGPGGVGKTTISAALSIKAALEDKAVAAMTVDPAPRLLEALGLGHQGAGRKPVDLTGLKRSKGRGQLSAMRLDPKLTFDRLVERYAPGPAARKAILDNRLYHNLSSTMAGVGNYMAMEKVVELYGDPSLELVVLDTPPAHEALEFLGAPQKLLDLLNSRAATMLGARQGFLGQGLKLTDYAARAILKAFDRLTRLDLLADVQDFIRSFEALYQGFAERAAQARALIAGDDCAVVLVTTAEPARVAETLRFFPALSKVGMRVHAVVVNRLLPALPNRGEIDRCHLPDVLKRKLRRNWQDFAALKTREATALRQVKAALPDAAILLAVPDLDRQVGCLADLAELATTLHPVTHAELAPKGRCSS